MNKLSFIIFLLILVQSTKAQNINIPDPNFKDALLNTKCIDTNGDGVYDEDADTNDDGEIQQSEAKAVIRLNISYNHIKTLKGIKEFTNLKELFCNDNGLTNLDLSQNINLVKLYCFNNQISYLATTHNLNLKTLECYSNQLTSLDISKNKELINLSCYSNKLQYLNTLNNENLEIVNCWGNKLLTLDFSKNPKLKILFCYLNELTSLNLKNGNNTGLNIMWSQINNNLSCIQVDTPSFSESIDGWIKSDLATYTKNCNSLGVNEHGKDIQITCYPNPVETLLNIKTTATNAIKSIKIYNPLGKIVLQQNTDLKQIDISKLNKGLYLVYIETDKHIIQRKIIKN
jgi:hypothetical protein